MNSMLQSMSNGVLTLDPARQDHHLQRRRRRIWVVQGRRHAGQGLLADLLGEDGGWVVNRIERVKEDGVSDIFPDAALSRSAACQIGQPHDHAAGWRATTARTSGRC